MKRSFWTEPFLWIHLAGLSALPLFVLLCLLGLATGTPLLPPILEVLLVGLAGTVPVLAMQFLRPFYIFGALFVALKPSLLTIEQRRLLTLLKTKSQPLIALFAAGLLLLLLWFLYQVAPVAAFVTPFPQFRLLGLLVAAFAFLGCNVFLLLPVSVAGLMLTNDVAFAATEPYAPDLIQRDFTILGVQLRRVLPSFLSDVTPASSTLPKEAPTTTVETSASSQNG